ncbi:thermonuclease family protein [Streptomyces sp. WAC05374]|uniref:thermonuclease family protein n=1 Tax=Streptomyces sp. WAC05374 TaxID=2487420 RepID=UPI000F870DA4|nr:thermonuclease family protein [Streptomyces sp. WAC05374]RST08043.1 thermonuclease family protein [Streptomyces sp. WAC05374]TDF50683.1 thermonuclease family protein [Streptomyces sp. WAC05374]TDF56973.1 thermonuclease family protein [Streptomyces sp. WAC05374]TDF60936.1 thermonuclease family protein [Streptomyces sp. WAC05374]
MRPSPWSRRGRTGVVAAALTTAVGLVTVVPAGADESPPTRQRGPVVLRVIDGDTLEVRGDGRVIPDGTVARVRLLEIDTPERGECFSREATARTAELLPVGSRLRTERDVELKDRFDRYLLYVWNDEDVFVNESLVRSGHATPVLFEPNDKYWPTMTTAERAARRAGAGLWSACPSR